MNLNEVNITKIDHQKCNELHDNMYRICFFCDKSIKLNYNNLKTCNNLCSQQFYCPFCLRHNHGFRSSRHILSFSFRAILGYYYYKYYLSNPTTLYYSQIEDIIKSHKRVGLQNPAFYYDDSNFMWYLNFNLVGNHRNKAPYSEIKTVILNVLNCFKIEKVISTSAKNHVHKKFDKAIQLFYQQRKRPKNKKVLIPTLDGAVAADKQEFFEETRNFVEFDFKAT